MPISTNGYALGLMGTFGIMNNLESLFDDVRALVLFLRGLKLAVVGLSLVNQALYYAQCLRSPRMAYRRDFTSARNIAVQVSYVTIPLQAAAMYAMVANHPGA